MRATLWALLVLLAPIALGSGGAAQADAGTGPVGDQECVGGTGAAAPCGWIAPILDLRFPEKPDCGGGYVLGVEAGPEACMVPPTADEPVTLEGTLNLYWDVSNDGTYPAEPLDEIQVDFRTSPGNPDWIRFEVEPSGFTLTNQDLVDPQRFRTTGEGLDAKVYYWYEEPITITFTRHGDPDSGELQEMRDAGGVQQVYARVQSSASGDRIREGFGIESFKFHGENDPVIADGLRETPFPVVPMSLAALAVTAWAARRRRG